MRVVVTSQGLHLRAKPNVGGYVVDILDHGDTLVQFGKPDAWRWVMVRSEKSGQYGYVYADFIKPLPDHVTESGPTNLPPPPPPPVVIAETRQPDPTPGDNFGPHRDTVEFCIYSIVVALIVVAVFWTLFSK